MLNSQRHVLLKRDYDARSKEVTTLELYDAENDWLESYKKLKIKIKGEKMVEQPKQVQYYNSSSTVVVE